MNTTLATIEPSQNKARSTEWINCLRSRAPSIVLVEEHEFLRAKWIKIAEEQGYRLATYADPKSFLEDLPCFSADTEFYLDQDFGSSRGVGLALARVVRRTFPEAMIHLVTDYPEFLFQTEIRSGLLTSVLGKLPRRFFLNDPDYEFFNA